MLSSERSEFDQHLGTLCAGFNVPVTDLRAEAYWRGLAKMQLSQFARVVEHALGPDGPERIPTSSQCWSLWRQIRAQRPKATESRPSDERQYDSLHCFGNRCLLRFLTVVGGVSEDTLTELLVAKGRVAENFRIISAEEDITAIEVRTAMFAAFERVTGTRVAAA